MCNIDLTKCICDTCEYIKSCKYAYGIGSCPFKHNNRYDPTYSDFFAMIKEGNSTSITNYSNVR